MLVGQFMPADAPRLTEARAGEIGTGSLTFRLSPGFEWAPQGFGEIPSASVVDLGHCARGSSALRLGPDGAQSVWLDPQGSDLTVEVSRASRRQCRAQVVFSGIQIHALHNGTGTVSYAGTATVAGLPSGSTLASLRTTPGSVGVGFGANHYGQTGSGIGGTIIPSPAQIPATSVPGVRLGAAWESSYAIQPDGTVKAWGRYTDGSAPSESPVTVTGLTEVAEVTGGWCHSLARRTDGTVLAWGCQAKGQIGNGVFDPGFQLPFAAPTTVSGVAAAIMVAAGEQTSYAVTADGSLYAWGDGELGQLGNGSRESSAVAQRVPGLSGVVGISARTSMAVALTADGSVWQWGWDQVSFGPDGTARIDLAPRRIAGLPPVRQVAAGQSFAIALAGDGMVWGWGDNRGGALGDGTTTTPSQPVRALGLTNAVRIAAGAAGSYAITADEVAYEWGLRDVDASVPAVPGPEANAAVRCRPCLRSGRRPVPRGCRRPLSLLMRALHPTRPAQ